MPTYEYICENCGHHFDLFQSIREEPIKICPKEKCAKKPWKKGRVTRAIGGGAGLIFKGSGFYATDYRSESYKEAAKKEASQSKPAPASGGDSKESSKPAAPKAEPAKSKEN